jgi:hypothetical protein
MGTDTMGFSPCPLISISVTSREDCQKTRCRATHPPAEGVAGAWRSRLATAARQIEPRKRLQFREFQQFSRRKISIILEEI